MTLPRIILRDVKLWTGYGNACQKRYWMTWKSSTKEHKPTSVGWKETLIQAEVARHLPQPRTHTQRWHKIAVQFYSCLYMIQWYQQSVSLQTTQHLMTRQKCIMNWKGRGRKLLQLAEVPPPTSFWKNWGKPKTNLSGEAMFLQRLDRGTPHTEVGNTAKLHSIISSDLGQVTFFAYNCKVIQKMWYQRFHNSIRKTKTNKRSQQSIFMSEASGKNAKTVTRSHRPVRRCSNWKHY